MKTNLRHGISVLAVAVGISVIGVTIPAVAAPFFQDHEQDYSKNKPITRACATGSTTMLVTKTTARRDITRKTRIRKRTSPATRSRAAINGMSEDAVLAAQLH